MFLIIDDIDEDERVTPVRPGDGLPYSPYPTHPTLHSFIHSSPVRDIVLHLPRHLSVRDRIPVRLEDGVPTYMHYAHHEGEA